MLFIGYSFSDPDVKQLFTWVKEILGKDFQRAYMIELGRVYDIHEYNYFLNLGINLIYASEMFEDFNKSNATEYLNKMLDYILDNKEKMGMIDEIFDYLKPFLNLNYTYSEYIKKAFEQYNPILIRYKLKLSSSENFNSEELLNLFNKNKLNDLSDIRIKNINLIFKKSILKEIILKDTKGNNKKFDIEGFDIPLCVKAIVEFDSIKLKMIQEKNEIMLNGSNAELYLEQGYISYILHDYTRAYSYMRNASLIFYHKKSYE